jgi:lysophospholipase L1-like esterase
MSRKSIVSVALSIMVTMVGIGLTVAPGISQAATPHVKKGKTPAYYVSLGDSYSIGYQPTSTNPGGGTPGYTAYVAKKEKLTLENFGCGGATTSSIITSIGCGDPASTNGVPYSTTTQEQAALDFIAANPGEVKLVTVSIGGNDVTSCAGISGATTSEILGCVETADTAITTNVTSLVSSLDGALTANGDSAPVIGLTYPDVILGDWVFPAGATNQSLASLSTVAFDDLINPALEAAYGGAANFVDVTQAPYKEATAGDDTPLTDTTKVGAYFKADGLLPDAVDEVCQLTYFCTLGNIHANDKGYKFIGSLIVAHLAATEATAH